MIKGAPVDLDRGDLARERHKVLTPHPATPEDVAGCVAEVVGHFDWKGPVGVTFPGVVTDGLTRTAANVDKGWIDQDARTLLLDEPSNHLDLDAVRALIQVAMTHHSASCLVH